MYRNATKCFLFLTVITIGIFQSMARTSKYDVPWNLDWKFFRGTPSGTPASPSYNDASWETVSVPHSASYDAPTVTTELAFYGTPSAPNKYYWYRKNFACPASARKVFIYFGAVMQSVTVYVNGTQVGTHFNSGYTGFFFDISSKVTRGGITCVALQCNINNNDSIPPGGANWATSNASPDFLLFSGMYRNVLLLFKDSVYVPLRGQRITVTGSTVSPAVHAITYVRNDAAEAKSVTVALTLNDASGNSVATQTATLPAPASGTTTFDMTTPAVSSPSLWSLSNPYLYSLQTLVSVGGSVVDSVVEPVGLRFFSWNASTPGGFSLNGTRTELRGMCLSQFMGWIENAVPPSRFAQQVAMMKAMGINSIRCSHYPRGDAFYHACDSVGMLVLVEVPSWGCCASFSGLNPFWSRIYACDSEMVLDGYNHPCIYGWSCFNEPAEQNLGPNFTNENTVIHGLDPTTGSGRVTMVANFGSTANAIYGYTAATDLDIMAENYATSNGSTKPFLNTEAYGNAQSDGNLNGNWYRNYVRGITTGTANDSNLSRGGEAFMEDSCMRTIYWLTNSKCAGAHFWCFQDYCSFRNTTGREGIVDRLWLPKNVYYRMKATLTGSADSGTEYWRTGTATKMVLTADRTSLFADGSDISLITATLRNAGNQVRQMPCNVTFTATPASCVRLLYGGNSTSTTDSGNPVTVGVEGGRCGVLLRASRTAGTITVIAANSCSLNADTVTLTSSPVSEVMPTFAWAPSGTGKNNRREVPMLHLRIIYTAKGAAISFPSGSKKEVQIIDCQGRTHASYALEKGVSLIVDRTRTGSGIFYLAWSNNGRRMLTRLSMVRQ